MVGQAQQQECEAVVKWYPQFGSRGMNAASQLVLSHFIQSETPVIGMAVGLSIAMNPL